MFARDRSVKTNKRTRGTLEKFSLSYSPHSRLKGSIWRGTVSPVASCLKRTSSLTLIDSTDRILSMNQNFNVSLSYGRHLGRHKAERQCDDFTSSHPQRSTVWLPVCLLSINYPGFAVASSLSHLFPTLSMLYFTSISPFLPFRSGRIIAL